MSEGVESYPVKPWILKRIYKLLPRPLRRIFECAIDGLIIGELIVSISVRQVKRLKVNQKKENVRKELKAKLT